MKNKLRGFSDVFKFTYTQSVKSKAYLVTLVIFCIIGLVLSPVITFFSSHDKKEESEYETGKINKIYICDYDTGLGKEIGDILKESTEYKDKTVSTVDKSEFDRVLEKLDKSEKGNVLLKIYFKDDLSNGFQGYQYVVYYGKGDDELEKNADDLCYFIDDNHKEAVSRLVSSDENIRNIIGSSVNFQQIKLDENQNEIVEGITENEYWVGYAVLMVVMFAISFAGSKVAELIVTEKSTKVIEYIMTSVKPMAMIIGKVAAAVLNILTMVAAFVLSVGCSTFIDKWIFATDTSSVGKILSGLFAADTMQSVNPATIIISVLMIAFGLVIYGLLAGVAGATVSKIEELAEGMKLYTFAMMIGAYLALMLLVSENAAGSDWGAFTYFVYLFPLSAPFITPAYLLIGKVSLGIGAGALGLMIICIILLLLFVSKVFEQLIYYNGAPLKIKALITMSKGSKGGKINE